MAYHACQNIDDYSSAYFFVWNALRNELIKLQDDEGNEISPPYSMDDIGIVPEEYRISANAFSELNIKYWELKEGFACEESVYQEMCAWITDNPCSVNNCMPNVGWVSCGAGPFVVVQSNDSATPYIIYDENDSSVHGEVLVWGHTHFGPCRPYPFCPENPQYVRWNCPLLGAPLDLVYETDPLDCKHYATLTSKPFVIYTPNTFTQIYSVVGDFDKSCGAGYSSPLVVASSVCKPDLFKSNGTWNYDIFSFERDADLESIVRKALSLSKMATIAQASERGCIGCTSVSLVPHIFLYDW